MPAVADAPTALTLEQVARLRRTVLRLSRRLRQQAHGGITPSQLAVLGTLDRDGPRTLGELAASEAVQPPSITRIVRALEDAGLVARVVVADDRRSNRVSATAAGRRLVQAIRSQRNAWLAERVATLKPRQLADLERGIAALERMLGDE